MQKVLAHQTRQAERFLKMSRGWHSYKPTKLQIISAISVLSEDSRFYET